MSSVPASHRPSHDAFRISAPYTKSGSRFSRWCMHGGGGGGPVARPPRPVPSPPLIVVVVFFDVRDDDGVVALRFHGDQAHRDATGDATEFVDGHRRCDRRPPRRPRHVHRPFTVRSSSSSSSSSSPVAARRRVVVVAVVVVRVSPLRARGIIVLQNDALRRRPAAAVVVVRAHPRRGTPRRHRLYHGACARLPRRVLRRSPRRCRRRHNHRRPPPFPLLLSMARRSAIAPTSSPLPTANSPTSYAPISIVGANVDCHIFITPHSESPSYRHAPHLVVSGASLVTLFSILRTADLLQIRV